MVSLSVRSTAGQHQSLHPLSRLAYALTWPYSVTAIIPKPPHFSDGIHAPHRNVLTDMMSSACLR
jgi:hypothetical protein